MTIKNLTVDGTINTSGQTAAGIASCVYGTTNITDCRSSVTINSYTLATADNVTTNNYPDLTQVYKVTVPKGVNVTSDKYEIGTDIYATANAQVTIAAADENKLIKSATVEGGTLTDGVYTLTATRDVEVSNPILIWNFAKVFASEDGTSDKPYTLDTATLGAGVKVSFNGGATIEVTSGEISFNADTSTFRFADDFRRQNFDGRERFGRRVSHSRERLRHCNYRFG